MEASAIGRRAQGNSRINDEFGGLCGVLVSEVVGVGLNSRASKDARAIQRQETEGANRFVAVGEDKVAGAARAFGVPLATVNSEVIGSSGRQAGEGEPLAVPGIGAISGIGEGTQKGFHVGAHARRDWIPVTIVGDDLIHGASHGIPDDIRR